MISRKPCISNTSRHRSTRRKTAPRRFKSGCHLQQFPPKSKDFGGFCYIFTVFCRAFEASKKTALLKICVLPTKRQTFWQLENPQSIAAQWIAGFCLSNWQSTGSIHTLYCDCRISGGLASLDVVVFQGHCGGRMSRLFLGQIYIAHLIIHVCEDGRAETDRSYIFFKLQVPFYAVAHTPHLRIG